MVNNHYLVVWNHGILNDFPFSWEFHDPNWRTHIFQRGWNHQPVIEMSTGDSLLAYFFLYLHIICSWKTCPATIFSSASHQNVRKSCSPSKSSSKFVFQEISRRFQKIFEEGPPTIAKKEVFHEMERAGMRLTALVGYQGALPCRYSWVKFQWSMAFEIK